MSQFQSCLLFFRAMQLASVFMSGVEVAIVANDACGSPVPWEFCCPWLFFDGKLFHSKWLQSSMNVATVDLCEGKVCIYGLCLLYLQFPPKVLGCHAPFVDTPSPLSPNIPLNVTGLVFLCFSLKSLLQLISTRAIVLNSP